MSPIDPIMMIPFTMNIGWYRTIIERGRCHRIVPSNVPGVHTIHTIDLIANCIIDIIISIIFCMKSIISMTIMWPFPFLIQSSGIFWSCHYYYYYQLPQPLLLLRLGFNVLCENSFTRILFTVSCCSTGCRKPIVMTKVIYINL